MSEPATKEDIAEVKESIKLLFDCVNSIKDNMSNYKEKVAENYINQTDCDACKSDKEKQNNFQNNFMIAIGGALLGTYGFLIGMIYWASAKFDSLNAITTQLAVLHKLTP